MKFLFVRSDICRKLPSDSTSRWTPLPLTMQFPLLGLARDFHPLDNAHVERTKRGEIHLQASEETKRYDTYTFSSKHKMTLIATYTCSWPEKTTKIAVITKKLEDYLELTRNLCNFGTKLYAMFVIWLILIYRHDLFTIESIAKPTQTETSWTMKLMVIIFSLFALCW